MQQIQSLSCCEAFEEDDRPSIGIGIILALLFDVYETATLK